MSCKQRLNFLTSLDALLDASWEGRDRDVLRLHDRFESMTEQVCADSSVSNTWCQPFTFRLGRLYYLLEHKLDVSVEDPLLERGFTDPSWQSLTEIPVWKRCNGGYSSEVSRYLSVCCP